MSYINRGKLLLIVLLSLITNSIQAQQINPFRGIGKKAEVIDISKGKYVEIIEKDSLERVGSVIMNRNTRKIERFLDNDLPNNKMDDITSQSRFFSVDPIAAKFPYYSPYQFAGNMPIWASDLDGLEPNFKHKSDGIYGVGLFDDRELGSIPKHQAMLRVGSGDKQFQIQWLLNNNGEAIGYLASRVIPEEEYKRIYGGSGEGLQPAYVIALDKFSEFGNNADKFYDYSRDAEFDDVMYGEIERSSVKSLFDPRYWLLGRVAGAAGNLSGQLFMRSATILSKAERVAIFQTRLANASSVGSVMDVIKLVNQTLDEVENAYSGVPKAKGIPNRDDGRMYGILDDTYVKKLEDGSTQALTKGHKIIIKENGAFTLMERKSGKIILEKSGKD